MSADCRMNQKTYPWCRVCLTSNVRMRSIEGIHREIYVKLTNSQPPEAICYICYSMLQRACRLSDMAHKSQKILEDMHRQGELHEIKMLPDFGIGLKLSVTDTSAALYYSDLEVHTVVKIETWCEVDEIKTEILDDVTDATDTVSNYDDPIYETTLIKTKEEETPTVIQQTITQNDRLPEINVTQINSNNDHNSSKTSEKVPFGSILCKNEINATSNSAKRVRTHTGTQSYVCNNCSKAFNIKSRLVQHMKTHIDGKHYKCNVCHKSFSTQQTLKIHIGIHTGEKPYECKICSKAFYLKKYLQLHMRFHTGEKPFECHLCQKSYARKQSLESHIATHSATYCRVKSYECNVCHKLLAHDHSLKTHMRTHTGEKPFECKVCSKTFSQQSNLQVHIKIHTDEKPHECSLCHKLFTQKQSLKQHMRTHTGEKPFECNVCYKAFTFKHNLGYHRKTHTREKPIKGNLALNLTCHSRENPQKD